MSTRGAVGIIYNNKEKIGYNHFDSYPAGLGNELLTFLKDKTIDELKTLFSNITIMKKVFWKTLFSNITIMKNSDNDVWNWQKHTFNTEFLDQHNFLNDSLFCEFAYLINLDTNKFEVYVGFNKNPNAAGRYAKYTLYKDYENVFYGVKLVKEIELTDLFAGKYSIVDNNFALA